MTTATKEQEKDIFDDLNIDKITKYAIPGALVCAGLVLGGVVLQGAYLGVAAAGSFWILLKRIKNGAPSLYNCILDHSGFADILVTIAATFVCGTTITGLAAAIITGLIVSTVFDYYKDNVGYVENTPSMTFSGIFKLITSKFKKDNPTEEGTETQTDESTDENVNEGVSNE